MSQNPASAHGNNHQFTALSSNAPKQDFVTMRIADQLFGIEVLGVQDILKYQHVTTVPLAPPEVYGLLNLRGRIVTIIDTRKRLGLTAAAEGSKPMIVVVEHNHEPFGLLVDNVGEVLRLPESDFETAPSNLSQNWQSVSLGVYMLSDELLIILDVQRLLLF